MACQDVKQIAVRPDLEKGIYFEKCEKTDDFTFLHVFEVNRIISIRNKSLLILQLTSKV